MLNPPVRRAGITALALLLSSAAPASSLAGDKDAGAETTRVSAPAPPPEPARLRQWAEQLAELRAEVEGLASELALMKDDPRSRMRSLQAERGDLESRVRREELRIEQLRQEAARVREATEIDAATTEALAPVLLESLDRVSAQIDAGLPFRTSDRKQEVERLRSQLEGGLLPPGKVASRLWQLVEDELRLSRESGLYKQVLPLAGDEVLAEVARIGMVGMYFRTEDGRLGVARAGPAGWTYDVLDGPDDRRLVAELFDALKKQIRVGYFELPQLLAQE